MGDMLKQLRALMEIRLHSSGIHEDILRHLRELMVTCSHLSRSIHGDMLITYHQFINTKLDNAY